MRAGQRRHLFGAVLSTCVVIAGLWGAPLDVTAEDNVFDIKADGLSVEGEGQTAEFSGNVVARRGDWVLTCSALIATYDDDGRIVGADARGPVVLAGPELHAEADSAHFDGALDAVVLQGSPTLRRGENVLRAESVTVHLTSRKIEMQGVVGHFRIDDATGRTGDD